jgi:AcrR family transcriptional regulator
MPSQKVRRGISQAEWLEAALQALSGRSVAEISVEQLARQLGISKSGFYWHFQDRADLLRTLLAYWVHETTEVVTENTELHKLKPKDRLIKTAEMILDHDLVRYEIGIRQWALEDKAAAKAVRAVNRIRLDFIRQAFLDYGFTGDDAETRAMMFVVYHTWESPMFREVPRKRRQQIIRRRIKILLAK